MQLELRLRRFGRRFPLRTRKEIGGDRLKKIVEHFLFANGENLKNAGNVELASRIFSSDIKGMVTF